MDPTRYKYYVFDMITTVITFEFQTNDNMIHSIYAISFLGVWYMKFLVYFNFHNNKMMKTAHCTQALNLQ